MNALRVFMAAVLILQTTTSCTVSKPVSASGERRPRTIAILLDLTDRLGVESLAQHKDFAHRAVADMRRGDSVSVYILDGKSQKPRQVWCAASPGRGSDAHALTEGRAFMERRFHAELIHPLDSLLVVAAASCDTSTTSGLLEAVWMVARHSPFAEASGPRSLVVVSDFIQNSSLFSFYREPAASFFSPDSTLRFPEWAVDLRGVVVLGEMLLRDRDSAIQSPHLVDEWTRLVESYGGSLTLTMVPVR